MSKLDTIRAVVMLAILLIAAIRPSWIWPYVLRAGAILLVLFVGLWVLSSLMGVRP